MEKILNHLSTFHNVPTYCIFFSEACFNLSDYDAPMFIYDIYKLILSILFLHFYLKYFMYGVSYKNFNFKITSYSDNNVLLCNNRWVI